MAKKAKPRSTLMKITDIHVPKTDYPEKPGQYPPSSAAFNKLKRTLKKKGMAVPVFVDEDKRILEGHYRLWAWQSLGNKFVAVVIIGKVDQIAQYFS